MLGANSAPGPARRAPGLTSHLPFFLGSSNEWFFGHGLAEELALDADADLLYSAKQLLANTPRGLPAVLVGALPFSTDGPAGPFRPARWTRSLPDTAALKATLPPSPPAPTHWHVHAHPTRAHYARTVEAALNEIARSDGSLRKVVLSRSLVLKADAPIAIGEVLLRLLRDPNVTTFAVPLPPCATGGQRALVGATPELLLSRRGPAVRSRPLAGSARRMADPGADTSAANALMRSEKDLREHATVVEWIADRLSPFCRSLHVPRSPSLVSTASMWHLASDIRGELASDASNSLELTRALHPTPAVCGMPFDRASQVIQRLEPFDRRFYTGAVGWCDSTGDGDWFVSIRCADICGHVAHLYAGAGIVAGSTPAGEATETAAKFRALLDAIHPGYSGQIVNEAL